MMNGMNNGWGMGFGWIIGLFVLIAIIWIIFKTINQNNKPAQLDKSALDILKERYASGEINKEEFEEKKKGLL
jgi:putative membrane protein